MILTGYEIIKQMSYKNIIITPYNNNQLNPNSYDLRLHNELLVYTDTFLDFKKENRTETILIPESGFVIRPGTLYLGRTVEWTETYHMAPKIEGKSSVGRKGLSIHVTAGFGDIGFKGYWVLEISSIHPVIIYPNMKICQIQYSTIKGNYGAGYQGKYQNQDKILPCKSYLDEEKGDL